MSHSSQKLFTRAFRETSPLKRSTTMSQRIQKSFDDEEQDSIGELSERTLVKMTSSIEHLAESLRSESFSSISDLGTREQFKTAVDNIKESMLALGDEVKPEQVREKTLVPVPKPVMDSPSDLSPNAPPAGGFDDPNFLAGLQGQPIEHQPTGPASTEGSVDSSGFEKVDHDVLEEYSQQFANQLQQSVFGQLPDEIDTRPDMSAPNDDVAEKEYGVPPPPTDSPIGGHHDDLLGDHHQHHPEPHHDYQHDSPRDFYDERPIDVVHHQPQHSDPHHEELPHSPVHHSPAHDKANDDLDDFLLDHKPHQAHPDPPHYEEVPEDAHHGHHEQDLFDLKDDVVVPAAEHDNHHHHHYEEPPHDEHPHPPHLHGLLDEEVLHRQQETDEFHGDPYAHSPGEESGRDTVGRLLGEDSDEDRPDFRSQTPEQEETTFERQGPLTIPELPEHHNHHHHDDLADFEPEILPTHSTGHHHGFETEPRPPTPPKDISDEEVQPAVVHLGHSSPHHVHHEPHHSILKTPSAHFFDKDLAWCNFKQVDPRVLDLIYWRDPKKSAVALSLTLIVLFVLAKYPLLTVISHVGLLVLAGTLGFRIFKVVEGQIKKTGGENPFKEYLNQDLALPQERVHAQVDVLVEHGTLFANHLKKLVFVESIVDSVKFGLLLWSLTYIASWFSGFALVILVVLGVFTLPKVYETYQEPIDAHLQVISGHINNVTNILEEKLPFLKRAEVVEKKDQ